MNILINRFRKRKESFCGELFIEGTYVGFTLEWITRDVKIPGKTGIPIGRYRLLPRREGEMFHDYSTRFKSEHPMLWLQDVPEFEYVYIHIGNWLKDTKGCILVGCTIGSDYDGNYYLGSSLTAYESIHREILAAWARNEEVWLEVKETYAK